MSFKTKKNLEMHLLCKRHSERAKKEKPTYPFVCDCGKKYCHRQSLYTHKMKCDGVKETEPKQNDAIPLVEKEQPEKMKQVYVTVEEMQEIIKLFKIEHQKMKAEIAVLTAAVNKREPETNKREPETIKREPAHEPEITNETTTTKRKKISKRVRVFSSVSQKKNIFV